VADQHKLNVRHYVLGNGPSLTRELVESLDPDLPTWSCNRIWKLWEMTDTQWRPSHYVRSEYPAYNERDVMEDLKKMAGVPSAMWLMAGFRGYTSAGWFNGPRSRLKPGPKYPEMNFVACNYGPHPWHLRIKANCTEGWKYNFMPGRAEQPWDGEKLSICGYGSVVHQAMQIAVTQNASEIVLLGCDLGTPRHFHGDHGSTVDDILMDAHRIAAKWCPIPIYNGGPANLPYPKWEEK